jgi:hypothetical protein
MLKWVIVGLFVVHGVAHLVGFVVPWRLMAVDGLSSGTTVLAGRVDVGETGMRMLGVGWLALALLCVVAGVGVAMEAPWAARVGFVVLAVSFVFCLIGLPDAVVGLAANVLLAVLLGVWVVTAAAAGWAATSDEARRALDTSSESPGGAIAADDFAGLPAPVARYLRHVLPDGARHVRAADTSQDAEFFVASGDGGAWKPLSATQHFVVTPPGFVWDARIRMAPMTDALVRDAYVGTGASMQASLLGVRTMVDQRGRPELDAGALHRYLAEAVWFPTALLPAAGVTWSRVDDRSAIATLTDGPTTVSLEFRFNDRDEVVEIFTPDRQREADGRYVPTPWLVTCRAYEVQQGLRVPSTCEVAWLLEAGPQPYWRGRVTIERYVY